MKNELIRLSRKIDVNAHYKDGRVDLEAVLEVVRLVAEHGGKEVYSNASRCGLEVSDLFIQVIEQVREAMRTS